MSKFFIDTNIFLRVLINEDENSFQECSSFLEAVKTNKYQAVTSSVILAEIVWTLLSFYSFTRIRVSQAIESILNLRGLQIIDNYNHQKSILLFSQKNIKYVDSLIASIEEIQTKKWIVVSYDKDFDKLGVIRKEPSQIV